MPDFKFTNLSDWFHNMTPEERKILSESVERMSESVRSHLTDAMLNGDPRKSPDYTTYGRPPHVDTGNLHNSWRANIPFRPNQHQPKDTGVKVTHRPDGGIAEVVIYPEK